MKSNRVVIIILALITLTGCREPVRDYYFTAIDKGRGWADDAPISLEVDMTDTLAPCELYFVGEVILQGGYCEVEGYPVGIKLISPAGRQFSDTLILPLNVKWGDGVSRTFGGVKEIEWPYRKNIYNKNAGRWRVILSKIDKNRDYSSLIGIGIYCKQNRYE